MWLLWLTAAEAGCDMALLSRIPLNDPKEKLEITSGKGVSMPPLAGGKEVVMAGARAVLHSAYPPSAWVEVVLHPENQDEWHPAEIGTKRVERLDADHIFQQAVFRVLGGTIQIKRQIVVGIDWMTISDQKLRNCWYAADPDPYQSKIAPWVDDSPWQKIGYGGWEVDPMPGGGSRVSYQMWVEADILPASVMSWGMSRTLPTLMNAFEARVASLNPR